MAGRPSTFHPVDDPLGRFRAIYAELDRDRTFFQSPAALRFSALAAVSCPGEPPAVAASIRALAEDLKHEASWFSSLKSDLRFIVAAVLLVHGEQAKTTLAAVGHARELFRAAKLRQGGSSYESLAGLILYLQRGCSPVDEATVARFGAIYEEMKRHHWWLTGPDDFPACAMLAASSELPPAEVGDGAEAIFQALREQGFSSGDPLQTAANILFLSGVSAEQLAHRYRALADAFRDAGISIWKSDYDELAILTFLDHEPTTVVDRVVTRRKDMEALKPKPDRFTTFDLACSITFLELVQLDRDLRAITDAKAMVDMQAVITAQQAATMAAVTAAISASTAANASGG